MKIGIFAKTFPGSDAETVLRQSASAGFEGVQYNMSCSGLAPMPDSISRETARAVAAASATTGQAVYAVSGTYNMIHPDPAVRHTGERQLAVIAAACRDMDVSLVTLCTGTRDATDQWRYHPQNSSTDAWRDLLQSMEAAVRIADAHNIMLGIEPEMANVVNSAEAARRLVDEMRSDRIGIVLDPANLAEQADSEERRRIIGHAVDVLAGRIVMAHAKDRAQDGSVVAPGKGVIDFGHFLARLAAIGFDGPLVAHGFEAKEARAAAQFLKGKRAALDRQ